ncbi:MAG: hypothetical protein ABII08_05500 [Candidatus Beckwithbacteria bacterium]|nr:hypothetical protein [Patescibacteria group bacterium]
MDESAERPKKFQNLGDIPGINPDGVNEDSGFRVGEVNSEEVIRRLTHLNGIPVTELETVMRPDKARGVGVGMYSYNGFLGEEESLIDALVRANQIVKENGHTHQQLAGWLDLARDAYHSKDRHFEHNDMRYEVTYAGTVSKGQWSPFKNSEVENDPEKEDWDGEYVVKNLTTGRTVGFTPPVSRWVRNWGFYEGFETPYHVSPQGLIDVFTRKDRVYETRDELVARLRKEYQGQGWEKVSIGHPDEVLPNYPLLYTVLVRYRDDPVGKEKIVQVLEDGNFTVATLGYYDQFRRYDLSFVVYDKTDEREPLVNCRDVARFNIDRSVEKGSVVIKTTIERDGRDDYPAEIVVGSEIDKDGWLVKQRGSFVQVGGFDLLKKYKGGFTGSSEDQFGVFRNPRVEFLTQDMEGSGAIWFLYKEDKVSETAEKVTLTGQVLKERFGIEVKEDNEYVSEVKKVSVGENGTVKGVMVIKGREEGFSL